MATPNMKIDYSVTLYSYMLDHENFLTHFKEAMEETMEGMVVGTEKKSDNDVTFTLFDDSTIRACIVSDAKEVEKQRNGLGGFYMQHPIKKRELMRSVIGQITKIQYLVGLSFYLDDNQNRTNTLFNVFFATAKKAGALVLNRSMQLMDANGKLLIDAEGNTAFEEYYPVADKKIFPQIEEDQCDIDRRERSFAVLRKLGLPYLEKKSPAIAEKDCTIATKDELIHRLACVFTASGCADYCVYSPDTAKEDVVELREQFEEAFNIREYASEYEMRYIDDPLGHARYHNIHTWRYECCYVLMWALGLVDADLPTECCDPVEICRLMMDTDYDDLCEKANPRSKEEILDKLDLIYRINWACTDARVNHKRVDVVDANVVYYWHYALNWIAGVGGIKNWDAVQPNT